MIICYRGGGVVQGQDVMLGLKIVGKMKIGKTKNSKYFFEKRGR